VPVGTQDPWACDPADNLFACSGLEQLSEHGSRIRPMARPHATRPFASLRRWGLPPPKTVAIIPTKSSPSDNRQDPP
jgi:hypothetical protein